MLNLDYFKLDSITDDDREKCSNLVTVMLDAAKFVWDKGCVAFQYSFEYTEPYEDYARYENNELKTDDYFFRALLPFLDNGLGVEENALDMREIAENFIISDQCTGAELLRRLIIAEGLLCLVQGMDEHEILYELQKIMDDKYTEKDIEPDAPDIRGYYYDNEVKDSDKQACIDTCMLILEMVSIARCSALLPLVDGSMMECG